MKDFDDSLNKSQQYLMDTIARSQAASGLKGSHTQHKTLRDEFAMAALNAMLQNPHKDGTNRGAGGVDTLAKYSYEYADAMMKAREVQS